MMIAAGCGVLVLSGCSGDDSAEPTSGPTVVKMPVSGHSLLVGGPVDEVNQERLSGKPTFVNGCLGAQTGTATYLVVWPDGTNVDRADSDAIEIDGKVLEPGASFVGKGTFVSSQPFPEEFPEIPLGCLGPNEEKIAWVQEIDEITE
jgi:hypothetical protein